MILRVYFPPATLVSGVAASLAALKGVETATVTGVTSAPDLCQIQFGDTRAIYSFECAEGRRGLFVLPTPWWLAACRSLIKAHGGECCVWVGCTQKWWGRNPPKKYKQPNRLTRSDVAEAKRIIKRLREKEED